MNKTSSLATIENWLRRQPHSVLVTSGILVLSLIFLVLNLIFLVSVISRINQTDIAPQEGQLLNRLSIEQAAELLREKTLVFEEE